MSRLFFTAFLLLLTATYALAQDAAKETTTGNGVPKQDAANDSVEVLTLQQALEQAQKNNRQIKIADQAVLYANDQILAVKTQRYPQFNVELLGSGLLTPINVEIPKGALGPVNGTLVPTENKNITTDPHFSALAFIQAYQPLSQLFNVHLNVQSAKVSKLLSEEQLRQQRQQITNSVKDSYYTLLQTQASLEAAQENVKALQEVDR